MQLNARIVTRYNIAHWVTVIWGRGVVLHVWKATEIGNMVKTFVGVQQINGLVNGRRV